jgi:hypothetical protein
MSAEDAYRGAFAPLATVERMHAEQKAYRERTEERLTLGGAKMVDHDRRIVKLEADVEEVEDATRPKPLDWKWVAGGIAALVGGLVVVGGWVWYAAKADSRIETVEKSVGEIRGDIRELTNNINQAALRGASVPYIAPRSAKGDEP